MGPLDKIISPVPADESSTQLDPQQVLTPFIVFSPKDFLKDPQVNGLYTEALILCFFF